MIVGCCEIEIYIYEAYSLKDKRMVIKSALEKMRNRFNISISEVGDNDLWNKAYISFCTVSNEQKKVNKTIQECLKFLEMNDRIEIINSVINYY
ncbi:DUF503 domain-containing protein [Vibrio parahaemolyticus]|nr:DUF503 domain-containing protein [Tissierellales bacterium]MDG2830165.1 DUF503 domain-containing protein [Vibrio parahaemolyticus]NMR87751.1 DUF503 domain-containing protein [Vibrio parahaemolyticus]